MYSTVTGGTIGYAASGNIHNLDLCGGSATNADGLWAFGADSSTWKDLYCSNAYYSGYDLNGSSFYSRAENLHSAGGHYGADYGGAFNGGMAINNGYDGNDVACVVHEGGGGGAYENYHEKCVNRGSLRYGWIEDQSSGEYYYPDMDMEGGTANFVSSVLLNGSLGYYFFGAGLSAATGSSFVTQDGGGVGATFIGAHFGIVSGTPNYIINYTNGTPTSPTQLINTVNPAGIPLASSPQYVYQPGTPLVSNVNVSGATTMVLPMLGTASQTFTMAASATITLPQDSALPPGTSQFISVFVCQNGTGGFTPTIAPIAGLTLVGTLPVFTTTINKCGDFGLNYDSPTHAYITGSNAGPL